LEFGVTAISRGATTGPRVKDRPCEVFQTPRPTMGQKHGKMTSKTQQMFFLIRGALKKQKRTPTYHTCANPIQKAPTHLVFLCVLFFDLLFLIAFSGVSQHVELKKTKKGLF
jgi:hypothetical protein